MLGWLFEPPLPVGSMAPDFALPDESGSVIRLSDLRGKKQVVLVWYPGDDTRICTQQLCEFRDAWMEAARPDLAIFGVNPQSAAKHSAFRARHGFSFPLLVDQHQAVGRLYKTYGWIVRRTVYGIDKDGVIRFAERGKPDVARVLAALT